MYLAFIDIQSEEVIITHELPNHCTTKLNDGKRAAEIPVAGRTI